ncbi:MAG: hypothetical protein AAGF87_08400 [Bacteroidota bacterium]
MKRTISYIVFSFFSSLLFGQSLLQNINTTPDSDANSRPNRWVSLNENHVIFAAILSGNNSTYYPYITNTDNYQTQLLDSFTVVSNLISFNGKVFFGGCDISLENPCLELYCTDGTIGEVALFKDLTASGISSSPNDFLVADDMFFFSADGSNTGRELWCSDGTPENTKLISNIMPGIGSGFQGEAVLLDNVVYFAALSPSSGIEPWRSDGTEEGTFKLAEINPGIASSMPTSFTASNGYIYFVAEDDNFGRELRRYDPLSDTLITIVQPGGPDVPGDPRFLENSDDRLFFTSRSPDSLTIGLWVIDQDEDPQYLGNQTGTPRSIIAFGDGEVLYTSFRPEIGSELYRSDGTVEGTQLVKDIFEGPGNGVFGGFGSNPEPFLVLGDSLLFFQGNDGSNNGDELFISDGTAQGTFQIGESWPGPEDGNPERFFIHNNHIFFQAQGPNTGFEPFAMPLDFLSTTFIPELSKAPFVISPPYPSPLIRSEEIKVDIKFEEPSRLFAQVYNQMGQTVTPVLDLGFLPEGNQTVRIPQDISSPGTYILLLVHDGGKAAFRIIVQ